MYKFVSIFYRKYRNKFIPADTDISLLDNELRQITNEYKLGLIVKDKTLIENHFYKNDASIQKELHEKIISNELLLDENDIIIGLKRFCNRFNNYSTEQFIETINNDYYNHQENN
jgi:hypothetical protein